MRPTSSEIRWTNKFLPKCSKQYNGFTSGLLMTKDVANNQSIKHLYWFRATFYNMNNIIKKTNTNNTFYIIEGHIKIVK